jgi:hypothetical protein
MLGMSLVRLPFCVGTSVPSEASQKFLYSQILGPQEKLAKINFVVQASTYAVGSMSSTDASKEQVQKDNSTTHTIRVVVRNPS